jgi:hypothetical protein
MALARVFVWLASDDAGVDAIIKGCNSTKKANGSGSGANHASMAEGPKF